MTEKYTLLIGLNDKDTKTQLVNTLEAYKMIMNVVKNYTDGATIYEAFGYYKHENGEMVEEKSLHVEILYFDDSGAKEKTKQIDKTIKTILNQDTVAVTYSKVESDLW